MYAIGGVNENDEDSEGDFPEENDDYPEDSSACECYDPTTDNWLTISPLPGRRTQHAGASIKFGTRHYLFISGGLDRDLVLSSVLCYDTAEDSWGLKSPMLTPRADHVMVAIGHKLFVCGGWKEEETGARFLVDTIDVYDIINDTWEVVTHIPTPRYHAGIVGVDNKIFFIGGFHSDVMFDRDTAAIECYNIDTDTWTTGDKYPQDVWEHTCVTMYIPTCRDDMEVIAANQNCT